MDLRLHRQKPCDQRGFLPAAAVTFVTVAAIAAAAVPYWLACPSTANTGAEPRHMKSSFGIIRLAVIYTGGPYIVNTFCPGRWSSPVQRYRIKHIPPVSCT